MKMGPLVNVNWPLYSFRGIFHHSRGIFHLGQVAGGVEAGEGVGDVRGEEGGGPATVTPKVAKIDLSK